MIRAATLADVEALAQLGCAIFGPVALSSPRLDHARDLARKIIGEGFAIIAESGDARSHARVICGSIGLRRMTWLHSGEVYLGDAWTYSTGMATLRSLIAAAGAVADRLAMPLYLGVTGKNTAAALRLYPWLGGELSGAIFRFSRSS